MKQTFMLSLFALVVSACAQPKVAGQQNAGIDYVGILTLVVTIVGWIVTAILQNRILDRQERAQKDIKSLEFAQRIAFSQREHKFEILPAARMKMIEAYSHLSHLGGGLLVHPDLNSWSHDQLSEWIEKLEFTDFQKGELLNSSDKNKYYLDTQFWYDVAKVNNRLDDFHNYLIEKQPFIDVELFSEFSSIEYTLREISNGIVLGRRSRDDSLERHYVIKFRTDVPTMIQNIEKSIREQLNQNFPL